MPTDRLRVPLFPIAVVVVGALVLAGVWAWSGLERDVKNFVTYPLLAGVILLIWLWFAARSNASRSVRLRVVWIGGALLVVLVAVFRLEGFTGDMQPKIAFRWVPKADELLDIPAAEVAKPEPAELGIAQKTAHDYPQFLGPERRAVVRGIRLARDWRAEPPQLVWRLPIGAGWSGFAVVGNYAITQEQRGEEELVVCYELRSGEIVWVHSDPGRFTSVMGGDGPRATPTISSGKVYVQGAFGLLNCLEAATGRRLWSHNIIDENGAVNIGWGRSGSPLVVDEMVIVSAGGPDGKSLVAYHKDSGERLWSGGSDQSSYSSPTLATLCDVRQVLIVNQDWLVSHRLSDGQELWRHPWPGNSNANASTSQPVPLAGNRVFVSKGYGIGCVLLQVIGGLDAPFSVASIWERPALMRTKMTNVVLRDGYLYGLSGGILECIELAGGKRMWKRGRYGHGQVILVDDLLLVTVEETGEVALVEASPEGHRELARFQAIEGKTWNTPALAGQYLLVRNHREAACYELPLVREPASGAANPPGSPE